jgi:ABC-2 type transport system ATP-binding protein
MDSSTPAITTRNVVKIYAEKSAAPVRALDGLDLDVQRGEIFGLLGRNGAGKTTLLRILTTLTRPTEGEAAVNGFDVVLSPLRVRQSICVVLQENAVEIYLSVMDNLTTFARFHGVPSAEIVSRAERVIDQFGLGDVRSQMVIDLSGGLKRRVQLSKVFMVDKPIIFLDEATTGMDPINKRTTLDAIRQQARQGRTVFLTTHMLQEAEELCDRVAIIDRGRCVALGDLPTIKGLASDVYDVSITFENLTPETHQALHMLPLLNKTVRANTVLLSVKGKDITPLDVLTALARTSTILHFEVTSASLEDVFLELLQRENRS